MLEMQERLASILERSRMSLMIDSRWRLEPSILSRRSISASASRPRGARDS